MNTHAHVFNCVFLCACSSHTWDHKDLQTLTNVEIDLEMQQLHTALRKILGMSPTYMRPPFGSCECCATRANCNSAD